MASNYIFQAFGSKSPTPGPASQTVHFLNRFLIVVYATVFACNSAQAQIIPDATLGNESSILSPGVAVRGEAADLIEGGAIRGGNLFHSFLNFNIDLGQRVYFASPDGIDSILSRVTGGNGSSLAGILGVDGTADLFLLNPNGIVFTGTSTLDISGSFYATTGDAISLGDGVFSAIQPVQSQLLAVSPSNAFENYLNSNSGDIISQGILQTGNNLTLAADQLTINSRLIAGNNLRLLATSDIAINDSSVTLETSRGQPGRTLVVQGRTISIADSDITTGLSVQDSPDQLILMADGDVDIRATADNTTFVGSFANTNGSAGNLTIRAANLRGIDEDATDDNDLLLLSVGLDGGNGGDITLDVQGMIWLDTARMGTFAVGTQRAGNAGNIRITATDLAGLNGTNIATATNADMVASVTGNAGDIDINVNGTLELSGVRQLDDGNTFTSFISSDALGQESPGNAGDIQITATELSLRDGAFISSSTSGQGSAGDIVFNIENVARLDGAVPVGPVFLSSSINSATSGQGDGGDILLEAERLIMTNGAGISAVTIRGTGNAGNVIVDVEDTVQIDGTDSGGVASRIAASSGVAAAGNGGDIQITANNLEVTGGARLSASLGNTRGSAGNIVLDIAETLRIQGSNLTPPATDRPLENRSAVLSNIQPTGDGMGGGIAITANNLIVADGGILDASVLGRGQAGDIVLNIAETARFAGVTPDGEFSGASATVSKDAQGSGGNLNITAGNLEVLAGAQLQTRVAGIGEAGDILLNIAETVRFAGVNPVSSQFPSGAFSNVAPEGNGNGGDIQIVAQELEITEAALLSASNLGTGETGNIAISLQEQLLLAEKGNISTITNDALSGGDVDVSARSIRLFDNSNIFATVRTGTGRGGNITLTADSIVALDDSDILAFSPAGRGGTIALNTPAFFGENLQLSPQLETVEDFRALNNNGRVDVNVSGGLSSGNAILPDVSFIENNLSELPDILLDPEILTASSCLVRQSDSTGSYVIANADELSQQPGDSRSVYSTGDVQPITPPLSGTAQTIEEPERIFQLSDGRLMLSQPCS